MPQKNSPPFLRFIITATVTLIIAGSVGLSGMAAFENWRFINLTSQLFDIVQYARNTAVAQKNFALTPGDDMWGNLLHLGIATNGAAPLNPWGQEVHATVINAASIRLETNLPAHDCRRFIYYLLNRQLTDIGLIALEARSTSSNAWIQIYPTSSIRVRGINAVEFGCGRTGPADLGLVFQIR